MSSIARSNADRPHLELVISDPVIPPGEPRGRAGWVDASGAVWVRDAFTCRWWPAFDQADYFGAQHARGLAWADLATTTGPGVVFALPQPPDGDHLAAVSA